MEPNRSSLTHRDTASSNLLDTHRNAHRVFRGPRRKADLFNPFRHIPWDYDHEAAPGQPLRSHHRKYPKPVSSNGLASSGWRLYFFRRDQKIFCPGWKIPSGVPVRMASSGEAVYSVKSNQENSPYVLDQRSASLRTNRTVPSLRQRTIC
jgi:hypothetical protein